MAREDAQLKFRVPAGLRALLEEAAGSAKRSLNAEITHRLERSFVDEELLPALSKEIRILQEHNGSLAKKLSDMEAEREHEKEYKLSDDVLYVLLDGDGLPTTWGEIMQHLETILTARGVDYRSIEARIVDADVVSSSKREEEFYNLVMETRKRLKAERAKMAERKAAKSTPEGG